MIARRRFLKLGALAPLAAAAAPVLNKLGSAASGPRLTIAQKLIGNGNHAIDTEEGVIMTNVGAGYQQVLPKVAFEWLSKEGEPGLLRFADGSMWRYVRNIRGGADLRHDIGRWVVAR